MNSINSFHASWRNALFSLGVNNYVLFVASDSPQDPGKTLIVDITLIKNSILGVHGLLDQAFPSGTCNAIDSGAPP